MGFAHNTIWRNFLCPLAVCGWISAFTILPGPIEVNENYMTLKSIIENVGVLQVPKDNIAFVKETHCITDPLGDDCRNCYFVLS
jgi:hypothetical protein